MLPAGLDYSIDLYKNAYPGDGTVKEKLTISGITSQIRFMTNKQLPIAVRHPQKIQREKLWQVCHLTLPTQEPL